MFFKTMFKNYFSLFPIFLLKSLFDILIIRPLTRTLQSTLFQKNQGAYNKREGRTEGRRVNWCLIYGTLN